MLEMGTSGLMSGEGKRVAARRPRTALFLDSTRAYAKAPPNPPYTALSTRIPRSYFGSYHQG